MDQATPASNLIQPIKARASQSQYRSTSAMLADIVRGSSDPISISTLFERLGDRGFGLALLLFAIPNAIPFPIPGISVITGMPLIFLSAQLFLGSNKIWLPSWLSRREISHSTLSVWVHKSIPWLLKLEKRVKPRLDAVVTRRHERFAGLLICILACLIALPVPLSNLPLGVAIMILALAITERDGLFMIIGWLLSCVAVLIFSALIVGYMWLSWQVIGSLL